MDLSHRDLPAQETFFVSSRVRSSLLASIGLGVEAFAGVQEHPGRSLDDTFEWAAAPFEDLRSGVRVVDSSELTKRYPGRWGLRSTMERDGLPLYVRPQDVPDGWPQPVWRVGAVDGLRWRIRGGRRTMLVADAFTVVGSIAESNVLGSGTPSVDRVLTGIASLTREQVGDFGWSGARAIDHPVLDRHDPLRSVFGRVAWRIIGAIEARAQSVDPEAGGEFYSGCYFVYRLTNERWLGTLTAALLAATAPLLEERLTEDQMDLRIRPWQVLVGELPSTALPAIDDPRLSVPPSTDLERALVPWHERGLTGRVWARLAFPFRHPILTAAPVLLLLGTALLLGPEVTLITFSVLLLMTIAIRRALPFELF